MKKHKDQTWKLCVRREVAIFPAFGVTESFALTRNVLKIPFEYKCIHFVGSEWWYPSDEYAKLKSILQKKIDEDPGWIIRTVQKQMRMGESLKRYVTQIARKRYDKRGLIAELQRYTDRMHAFYAFWWMAIPASEILEAKVRAILKDSSAPVAFDELIFVPRTLELLKQRQELMRIGRTVHGKSMHELSSTTLKALKRHAQQYAWITCSYHLGTPLTVKDFFHSIQEEQPKEALQKIAGEEKSKEKILKMLQRQLTKGQMDTILAMQEIIFSRNYQKETVNKCQYTSEPFLKYIASQLKLEWKEFLTFTPYEVLAILLGKQKPNTANRDTFAIILQNKKCFVTTDVAKYVISPDIRDDQHRGNELKGSPACPGIVQGNVRVIMSKAEISLFKKGEILVTTMTSIDFVYSMKQAAAIVTDEGGITCHAAIFSRELNIPCIIGTKYATKVLKTGDRIEVDAVHGIVRKVS